MNIFQIFQIGKQLKKYYGRSKLISDTGLEVLMKDEELANISGGLNGTIINAISRLISTLLELGRTIGSSLNRFKHKNKC